MISKEEIGAYVWVKDNLPRNSNMFTFVNNGPVIGMDMYTCHWCEDVRYYMRNGFNQSAEDCNGISWHRSSIRAWDLLD